MTIHWGEKNKLAAVLTLAFSLRVLFAFAVLPSFYADRDLDSAGGYDQIAQTLVQGGGFAYPGGVVDVFRTPVYTLFLAVHYAVFGGRNDVIIFSQLLLSVMTVWLAWLLARRLVGLRAAWITGIILSLNPFAIWRFPNLLADVIWVPLILAAVLVAHSVVTAPSVRRLWRVTLTGVLCGIVTLTKPLGLLFPGVVALAWLINWPIPLVIRIRAIMLMSGIYLLTLSPWVARNYQVTGNFPVVACGSSIPMFHGLTYAHYFSWQNMSGHELDRRAQQDYTVLADKLGVTLLPIPGRLSYHDDIIFKSYLNKQRKENLLDAMNVYLKNLAFFWFLGNSHGKSIAYLCLYIPILILAGYAVFWSPRTVLVRRKRWCWLAVPLVYFWMLNSWIIGSARYADPAIIFGAILAAIPLAAKREKVEEL